MNGITISISMPMPTERPEDVMLCDECSQKHTKTDGCLDNLDAMEELHILKAEGLLTGKELIDKEGPDGA